METPGEDVADGREPVFLPHPLTGQMFPSPVPPGIGWPEDPASADTPVAHTAAEVRELARTASTVAEIDARSSVCRACPRLVAWREEVARIKRAAYAGQPYWGRPAASFGDPDPRMIVLGLAPAAHGANRTGRMFTGDRSGEWIVGALHRAGLADRDHAGVAGDDQRFHGVRMVAPVRCAPPANKPLTSEKETCSAWLDRELTLLTSVTSILALGGIAWTSALQAAVRLGWQVPRPRPPFGHGAEVILKAPAAPSEDGDHGEREIRLVGCYHVSQQNTFTGKLTREMLDQAITRAAPR
ncbi:MAG: uracil-DNA glycosylase [Dermatophilus congolensis]|nr:uracil-DNA glycosylase [Dermatophilus congolensis]